MAIKSNSGLGLSYTPDATLNGPWTHTRPDIPLFKTGSPASLPGNSGFGRRGGNGIGSGGRFDAQNSFQQAFQNWMNSRGGGFNGVFAGFDMGGGGRHRGGSPGSPGSGGTPPSQNNGGVTGGAITGAPGSPGGSITPPTGQWQDPGFSLTPGQLPPPRPPVSSPPPINGGNVAHPIGIGGGSGMTTLPTPVTRPIMPGGISSGSSGSGSRYRNMLANALSAGATRR